MDYRQGIWTLAQADPKPAPAAESAPAPESTTATEGEAAPIGGEGGAGGTPRSPFDGGMIFFFVILILMMWVMIFLPQRREKKKHAQMLANLKKGDKVQTIGGILGTVIDLRDREVVLKVDEANNTRMRFTRAAIHAVVEGSKEE